ncbi:MAG: hypothetical protein J6332_00540 [Abditibacteriota bacterium]|nr:hypothetical protein [Abditibacteriota bacterium]
MKKLIAFLALSAVACAAAFADISVTNWDASYGGPSDFAVNDYAPAGFDVYLPETSSKVVFGFHSESANDWLYNRNEPLILVVDGFDDDDFSATEGVFSITVADVT